ncbi:ABC1 kinase family protein [Inquilinus sp. OTU3971]|uniref:ABC1 kinase family protein n=1 Tax=Inquilinus sp. OTU3971 TaxID=3043855 RepID=UPI00313A8128
MTEPGPSLTTRLMRYGRVGLALARFLSSLAGDRYLGAHRDPAELARALRQDLGELRGPIVKVAQLLATVPGALPTAYVTELASLQSQAPPMGWPFVRRRMAGELGPQWETRFARFEHAAAAAASLGQVHQAVGHDGRILACKLQYPDMEAVVDADLSGLDVALRIFHQLRPPLIMGQVRAEMEARLREELDYTLEARHMALFRDILRDEPLLSVPEPVWPLTTKRLLTMSWLEGRPVLDLTAASERAKVAKTLFRAWYVPFFHYGVLHGDPHLGNYTVRADGGLNLLDFGCVRIFPPALVQGVIDLYEAVRTGNTDLAAHAYRTWHFQHLTKEVLHALNTWASYMFEPLVENKQRTFGDLTGDLPGREVAERVIAELHRAGGIDVPREFVIMDRAAIGLGAVFLRLQAEVNWHRLFGDMVAGFDIDALRERQAAMLEKHQLLAPAEKPPHP